jgi:hypothetical protein
MAASRRRVQKPFQGVTWRCLVTGEQFDDLDHDGRPAFQKGAPYIVDLGATCRQPARAMLQEFLNAFQTFVNLIPTDQPIFSLGVKAGKVKMAQMPLQGRRSTVRLVIEGDT